MNLRKAALSSIALAASLTVLLAGCGTSNSTPVTNTTTTGGSSTPVNGGTLTIGQGTKFDDQLIPDIDSSLYTANVYGFAYDSLLMNDKNLNFIGDLAKSWSWSADKKTLTMTLQPNLKWSDGQPITSADVLFTINYLASKDYNTTLQGQYGYLVGSIVGANRIGAGKATSFDKTGGFTKVSGSSFSLNFHNVDAAVLWSQIASIQPLPEHALKGIPIKDWGTSSFDKMPTVVSGPFEFTKVNGSDSVEMAPNANYWQGKPHIAKLVIKTVSEDVAPGLLANGSVDFMLNGLKPTDYTKLQQLPGITVKKLPENGFNYLGLKLYQKEFQDVRVRQAFEYALDRNTMVKGIDKGLATPISGPLPPVSWAAATTTDGMNPYNYSPSKANTLLDQAGWKKGSNGFRVDPVTGKEADLHLEYSSGSPVTEAEAVSIQQYLGAVGVKVTLDAPLDFNALVKKVENDDKTLYMWLMAWSLSADPDPRGLWDSTDAMNFPRWKDAQNDKLIGATWNAAAFDKATRKQAFVAWQLYVNKQLPYIFLWAPDNLWAYDSHVNIPANDWNVYGPFNSQQWWVTSK